jgi:hypothetical protein
MRYGYKDIVLGVSGSKPTASELQNLLRCEGDVKVGKRCQN